MERIEEHDDSYIDRMLEANLKVCHGCSSSRDDGDNLLCAEAPEDNCYCDQLSGCPLANW